MPNVPKTDEFEVEIDTPMLFSHNINFEPKPAYLPQMAEAGNYDMFTQEMKLMQATDYRRQERPERFQMREFEDYTITYACNGITKRMNKILTCKFCSK